jgi:hypothetical protein
MTDAAQYQCKWPTCQNEEYQQALAEQIKQELVTGKPWVGLTDEDVNRESAPITSQMKLAFHAGMYVAQKILKERNT